MAESDTSGPLAGLERPGFKRNRQALSNMAEVVTRKLPELRKHPISKEIYDQTTDDISDRFIQDIEANGVEEPIIINEDDRILDGIRRWMAAKRVDDIDSIECIVRSYEDEEKAILRLNDDRAETFRQKMEVATRYKEKAEDALRERMELGKSLDELDPEEDPAQEFAEGENATAMELAADRVGWSDETFRKALKIWTRAEEGAGGPNDEGNVPYQLVEDINIGNLSITAAHQEFMDWLRGKAGRYRVTWSDYMQASAHDQMFDIYEDNLNANLADLDPDDDWRDQIKELRQHLEGVIGDLNQIENSDMVFTWHLEKRGYIDLNDEDIAAASLVEKEPDKEELEELYLEEEMTIGQLATYYGVNIELIKAWMRDKQVPIRYGSIRDPNARKSLKHQNRYIEEPDDDDESGGYPGADNTIAEPDPW